MSDILQEHNPWDKNGLWKHELRRVRDLHPNPKNPRTITEQSLKGLRESLKDNGYTMRLIVDSHNKILSGHARWIIMNQDDPDAVIEVLVAQRELTEQEEKDAILGHNVLGGSWDIESAQMNFDPIDWQKFDLTFDIDDLPGAEKQIEEDEIPETAPQICKRGDVWKLDNHRLMCGDSTNADDVAKLMNGEKVDLLFTDPPYGVNYESKNKEVLRTKNYSNILNDDLHGDDFKNFLYSVFKNAHDVLKETASYYIFSCQGGDQEMMMMMMMRECGIPCRHQLIWVKDSPVFSMGRLDYDYKHEPILYGWVKKHTFQRKGEQDKSVWEYKRTENKIHPTMKPVDLICNALKNSTVANDYVLDLFGGSGSTLIACEQLNRKCFMMELDPHYCDVIIARWEKLTGKTAEKEENENI